MCSREEVQDELKKCEDRIMALVHEEIRVLREQAQTAIIDRNSVHMLLEQMRKDNKINQTLSEKILDQTTRTNGRVTHVESWQTSHDVTTAHMKESIQAMQTYFSRLNWALILAVLGALLALVFK